MTTKYLSPNPKFQAFDSDGNPLVGGKLYTYGAGGSTPLATYTDSTGASANSNPIILDANGEANVWLSNAAYKFTLKDANDVLQWTVDNIIGVGFVQANIVYWGATSSGSANAQTIITNPQFTTYQTPLIISFISGFNNTGPTTINANSLGAVNILKESTSGPVPLTGGEIIEGNIYQLSFDGTDFQILNSPSNFPGAETTVASATTTSISNHNTNAIAISGTTTITSFGTSGDSTSAFYFLRFTGSLTLTNNATSLILPGGANIVTQAGDTAIVQDLGSNNWKVTQYTRVNGSPILPSGVQGQFKNLKTAWASNTTLTITADQITLYAPTLPAWLTVSTVNLTNTISTSGANGLDTGSVANSTWYYSYVIYNPTTLTTASLISLSSTAPTLPSGYTYFARVGSFITDGSAHIVGFTQKGKSIQYMVGSNASLPQAASGPSGSVSVPTWTAVSISSFIPPTTSKITVMLFSGSTNSNAMAAPNNNYGAAGSTTNPPPLSLAGTQSAGIYSNNIMGTFVCEQTSNFYYASTAATSGLYVVNYEDNI